MVMLELMLLQLVVLNYKLVLQALQLVYSEHTLIIFLLILDIHMEEVAVEL